MTSANSDVNALFVTSTTVYAGGAFTNIGGAARNRIAALSVTSGLATAWNPNADASINALGVAGSTVFAGGDFTSIGGQARSKVASLDGTSGVATSWNPSASGSVYALAVSGSVAFVGGFFDVIGNLPQTNFAAMGSGVVDVPFQPRDPSLTLLRQNEPNPCRGRTTIPFSLPRAASVTLKIYDVAGREVANLLENEYRLPGRYEVKFDGRVLASGVYMYRLVTGSTVETRKMVLVR